MAGKELVILSLYDMANASNEAREQNLMRLKQAYREGKVVTVKSACDYFGYTEATIIKWCKDAKVPLIDTKRHRYVVPIDES